ncbi:hypothetical protein [Nostoc sp.]|uniref:hypothetical protein n=1 Tax=Nostoc sp. TaxID=1180 RepID=UPI003593781C
MHIGDRIWKTSDPELDKQLRQSFSGENPQFQRPIDVEIYGEVIIDACNTGNINY